MPTHRRFAVLAGLLLTVALAAPAFGAPSVAA